MPKISLQAKVIVLGLGILVLGGAALLLFWRPGSKPPASPAITLGQIRDLKLSGDWATLAKTLDGTVVVVPEGEFVRGSNVTRWDERPEQSIYLDRFEIDQFEVTNCQYQRFVQATARQAPPYWTGDQFPAGQADFAVAGVTWDEASAYCQWAGKRLPTEAEWEKACRGVDGRIYPWGNEWQTGQGNTDLLAGSYEFPDVPGSAPSPQDNAWGFLEATPGVPGSRGLMPVGSYLSSASPYGVMDMVGNVSEWVADWYVNADYSQLPLRNPQTLSPHWNHALRGSPWYDPVGGPEWVQDQSRCSARNSSHELRDARVGFRCARTVGAPGSPAEMPTQAAPGQ